MPIREYKPRPASDTVLRVIGKGLSYPFTFSSRGKSKQLSVEGGVERVNQAIHQILSTRPGERMMLPRFGSRLPELVFEPEDELLYDLLYLHTVEALQEWEKRIEINNVLIIPSEQMVNNNTVGIMIEYSIRGSHVRGSYVYPFQLGAMPFDETI